MAFSSCFRASSSGTAGSKYAAGRLLEYVALHGSILMVIVPPVPLSSVQVEVMSVFE